MTIFYHIKILKQIKLKKIIELLLYLDINILINIYFRIKEDDKL